MGIGLELAGQRRDGGTFPVDVSLAPVEVRGARFAAAFVRDSRERQRGIDRLHAVNEITQQVLAGSQLNDVISLIAARARQLSRSHAVWIVAPGSEARLEVTSVDGPGTEILLGVALSAESSRSAAVMRTGTSEVIEDLSVATNVPIEVKALDLGPGLYVPLIADERRLGTLVIARRHGAPAFDRVDLAFAEVFASSAAAAIELGEVRSELERLGIVNEEERIARDLHDTVIQEIFAVGMALQATRATVSGVAGERIDAAVDRLDGIIRQIRNTIFRLPGQGSGVGGLRDEMLRIADKYTEELGFTPRFAFDGPVDALVPEIVTSHLVQVVAEALSNVARHANASSAEVVVAVIDGWLSLSLADDGVGISDSPTAGQGLRNMATRASSLGGSCELTRRDPTGTVLKWSVPI
jgi:signal transduction histidine kinase